MERAMENMIMERVLERNIEHTEMSARIAKTREYLDYIEEHCSNVRKAWKEISEKCKDMRFVWDDYVWFTINDAVLQHDLSKLDEEEFVQYRKAFYPTEVEKAVNGKYDMSAAWESHKANNPHHWENWTKIAAEDPYTHEVHCVHMVIDWTAMGYKFGDTAKEYYERNKDRISLPQWAIEFIYEIFRRVESVSEENDVKHRDYGRPI